jgi:DNA-binding transcriptional LysR family regulator
MNEQDWEMLIILAEEKNITRAAERLFVAQSSLSYRLKNLEEELSVPLLLRTKNGIFFTPEGEYVLQYAKNMKIQLENTREHILNMRETVQGTLRLAATTAFAYYVLPDLLKTFREQYPKIEFYLKTNKSNNIYRMLEKDEVTLAIVRGDHPWIEEKYLLCEEPICLVSGSPLEISELPDFPLITHPYSGVHDIVQRWWQQNFSLSPRISMEIDNVDIGLQMILRNLGWGILPAIGLENYPSLYKKNLYWQDGTPITRKTW